MRAIHVSGSPSLFGFTRYQWRVFFVVWLGWALDATDFGPFSLVLKPAATEILDGAVGSDKISSPVDHPPLNRTRAIRLLDRVLNSERDQALW